VFYANILLIIIDLYIARSVSLLLAHSFWEKQQIIIMSSGPYFRNLEKSRLSDEIAREIAQVIREGRYQPGQVLPSERELAKQFNVSRPVLREALRILEIQGLIDIRHGSGAYVKNYGTDILDVPIQEWLNENYSLFLQFYEARLTLEPTCAALAAQRANADEIKLLRQMITSEKALLEQENIPTFIGLDIDLHAAVANLSGNTFLIRMLETLINPETDMRKIVLRLPNHLNVAHTGHSAIIEAIARHDPEAARQAMIAALQSPLDAVQSFLTNQEPGNA
jgi:GntR family transcriptional repressor for pyruvate dehydrogenase complex